MACRCKCGYPFYTSSAASYTCPRCGSAVECEGQPKQEWPTWAKQVKKYRHPDDTGVGDTIKRLLGKWGDWFTALMDKWGIDCGCPGRRKHYNALYPYKE